MADGITAIVWAAITALLGMAAWRLSAHVAPADSVGARLVHTMVFCWAALVGSAILLAIFGRLERGWLLGSVGMLSLGVALTVGRRSADRNVDRSALAVWLVWLASVSGYIVVCGIWRFPTDWDTLTYHLPLVDQWLQAKALYAPRDAIWYNAGNNEIVGLWFVAPFSGDFLIALNNLLPSSVLICGATGLLAQLGARKPVAVLGGFAIIASRIVFRQLIDAENDVAVAALFVASIFYGVRYGKDGGHGDLVCGGISVGLLGGVKYYALGYCAVAALFLVLMANARSGVRDCIRTFFYVVLGVMLFAGYWYGRNMWVTGTPIYPKGFTPATDELSHWSVGREGLWITTLVGCGRAEVVPLAFGAVYRMGGPCYWIALFLFPVVCVWAFGVRGGRLGSGAGGKRPMRIPLWAALLGAGAVWGVTPWVVETNGSYASLLGGYIPVRFGMAFLVLALLLALVMMEGWADQLGRWSCSRFGRQGTWWSDAWVYTVWLVCLFSCAGYTYVKEFLGFLSSWGLVDAILIAANAGFAICLVMLVAWPYKAVFLVALLGAFGLGVGHLAERWHAGFNAFYDRHLFRGDVLERLSEGDAIETRIAVFDYRYYPCLGSRRQFTVMRSHRQRSYQAVKSFLLAHGATTVVVISADPFPNGWYHGPRNWIVNDSTVFEAVEGSGSAYVFRVNRSKLARD